MANIGTYLQKILDAVYGEEVRGSIHDALAAMNTESSGAVQYASAARDSAQASALAAAASAQSAMQYSGKPPKPQNGTWHIWDADAQAYTDSGIGCELAGPPGTSIRDIRLTKGDHSPGTTDIYTVTLTDETAYGISVYNGRNGTGAGDVLGMSFDLILPASGWQDGTITVADSRLTAQEVCKYFIDVHEDSRAQYRDCGVRAEDITENGRITFRSDRAPSADLTVHVVRLELPAGGTPPQEEA